MKKTYLAFVLYFLLIISANSKEVSLMMLYTSDEHGWMINEGKNGGASSMYYQWVNSDSIKFKNTLILSGGDNFTGQAISTFTNGRAMQEVMAAMGYQYSAIGNHEFDFGLKELNKRMSQSEYDYLSANVNFPELIDTNSNLKPYIIKSVDGIRIGIIGLANKNTPDYCNPNNVKGVKFKDYETAIIRNMKYIKNCEIKVLVTHICAEDLKELAPFAKKHKINIMLGGHCHTPTSEVVDSILIVEGNPFLRGYARIDLTYDVYKNYLSSISCKLIENKRIGSDANIDKVVEKWKDSVDKILDEPIAFNESELDADSPALTNLILDSWLKKYQNVQIAMTNRGSIRQPLPQGNVTLGTILGIMPFENTLIICEMKGSDIKKNIEKHKPFLSGINVFEDYKVNGASNLEPEKYYTVIMPDFIFNNGDGYDIKDKAKNVKNTAENPRNPLIKYLKNLGTSWNKPLTKYLDFTPKSPAEDK